jgi:hypothetical protein
MNPSNSSPVKNFDSNPGVRPEMQLPVPVAEQAGATVPPEAASRPPEQTTGTPELSALNTTAPATMTVNDAYAAATATPSNGKTAANSGNDINTTASAVPTAADDGDLIEKEWVNKAKEIVARTIDDPYKQSKELTVFKADYMQKRYGKSIKLSE